MAKVEIKLSDDLVARIDRAAERANETRADFLRRATQNEVVASEGRLRKELEEMLGPPEPMGGNAAELIREMRDNHPSVHRGNTNDE